MPRGTAAPLRDAAQIRTEIAAERQRLDDDLTELERNLLSTAPFVVAGLVAVVGAVVFAKSRSARRPKPISLTVKFD
jgi:hypothetical protein